MGHPEPDEQKWLEELRRGGRTAFEQLLDRYERRVYNLAFRMLGDPTEAEDATQDIFVQVHRSLPGFRGQSRLDTWIHRIGVNVCLQRRRRRKLPTVELLEHDPVTEGEEDPIHAAMAGELRSCLEDAIQRLPEAQRTVVLLHGMQGLSYSEVADALGCPVGTVKSRLSTAFRRLRQLLAPYIAPDEVQGRSCCAEVTP